MGSKRAVDMGRRAFLRGRFSENELRATTRRAVIDPAACMAMNGVICISCQQACNDGAILFDDRLRPRIDAERCRASGSCISVCPENAIELFRPGTTDQT